MTRIITKASSLAGLQVLLLLAADKSLAYQSSHSTAAFRRPGLASRATAPHDAWGLSSSWQSRRGTHYYSRPNAAVVLLAKKKEHSGEEQQQPPNESGNEWGIPYSDTLPPLGNNQMPVPTQLANGGRVTLLGSGPGDPDLLTVAAYKLLTQPTGYKPLVIADRLVSPEILNLIAHDAAEVKVARKLPGCAELAQEEIYWWTYQALNQGRHVIRLKIGDPFVFGRGGEEVLTFRRFGVQAVVIPGVSAAFSAPLLAHIPVTHRGVSNQVVMCTGYGREGTSPDLIRYHEEQTVVFLMAVGRLRELCQRLITLAGYPATVPVAVVERAGCPNQRTVVGDLTTIADIVKEYNIQPPSTIIVGEVVNVLLADDYESMETTLSGLVQNFTTGVF